MFLVLQVVLRYAMPKRQPVCAGVDVSLIGAVLEVLWGWMHCMLCGVRFGACCFVS